jgi:hypothetical protein
LFEIYVGRFSYTLLGNGGASKNPLVSIALIARTGLALGAWIGAAIIAGYFLGFTYSINPSLGNATCLAKDLTTSNKT